MELILSKKTVKQYLNIWGRNVPIIFFNSKPEKVDIKRDFSYQSTSKTPIPFPSQTFEAQMKRAQRLHREERVIVFIVTLFVVLLLTGFIPRV